MYMTDVANGTTEPRITQTYAERAMRLPPGALSMTVEDIPPSMLTKFTINAVEVPPPDPETFDLDDMPLSHAEMLCLPSELYKG